VEPRGGIKENADQQTTVRTQSREAVSHAQAHIREAVTRNRTQPLITLLHHVSVDVLRAGFLGLKKTAAPGVDGLTWTQYEEDLEANRSITAVHRDIKKIFIYRSGRQHWPFLQTGRNGRLVRRMSHRVDPAAIAEEARTVRLDAVLGPPRRSVPVGDSSTPESRTLTPLIMVRIQVPQPGSRPQIAAYL
jgi:hypothetical protein